MGIAHAFPTPMLRLKHRMWGLEEDGPLVPELWHQWARTEGGDLLHPLHPSCYRLTHGVFSSAVAAIDAIISPNRALLEPPGEPESWVFEFRRRWAFQLVQSGQSDEVPEPSTESQQPLSQVTHAELTLRL